MRSKSFLRSLRLGLAALIAAGCATDSATAPKFSQEASTARGSGSRDDLIKKNGLLWSTELRRDVSASATIGPRGGKITIASTGFELTVPPLAVTKDTRFTVTAVAGRMVAYEFEPHGTRFLVPIIAKQNLALTKSRLPLPVLLAGYFTYRYDLDQSNGTGYVSELIDGAGGAALGSFVWPINHFSGYMICW